MQEVLDQVTLEQIKRLIESAGREMSEESEDARNFPTQETWGESGGNV